MAISFGCTRVASFEHAKSRNTIDIPQPDGHIYTFSRDTNIIWRHGILHEDSYPNATNTHTTPGPQGRISIIAWGWIDRMIEV